MFRPFFPEDPYDAIDGVDYLNVSLSEFMKLPKELRLLLMRIEESF